MIHFVEHDILNRYKDWLQSSGLSEKTVYNEIHYLRIFFPRVYEQTEDRIIEGIIQREQDHRDWSKKTGYKARVFLKKFFYWVYEWEKLRTGRTPYQRFFARKGPSPEPKFLLDQDVVKIFENPFLQIRDSILVRIAYYSGARRSELSAMNIEDVDFENQTLHVRKGKLGDWRYVKIDDASCRALLEYVEGLKLNGHGEPKDPLFVVAGWKRATPHRIWKRIHQAGQMIGKDIHPHELRHSIGRTILMRGGTVAHVQRHLGHKSASQAMQYIHLTENDTAKFLERRKP